GGFFKQGTDVVGARHEQARPLKPPAVMLLIPPLGLVARPFSEVLLSLGLKDPLASFGQGSPARLQFPSPGSLGHSTIGAIEEQVAQIHRLEDDTVLGVALMDTFHEKGTKPG